MTGFIFLFFVFFQRQVLHRYLQYVTEARVKETGVSLDLDASPVEYRAVGPQLVELGGCLPGGTADRLSPPLNYKIDR